MNDSSTGIVDSQALHERVERKRFEEATGCPHLALDKPETSCLWHRSFCLHPERGDPEVTGMYEHCDLVWKGHCPFGWSSTGKPA